MLAVASIHHRHWVALIISATAALSLLCYRRTANMAWFALGAVVLGTWAQVLLLSDNIPLGVGLYAMAFVLAFASGMALVQRRPARVNLRVDLALIITATGAALLFRLIAIDTMPWFVDVEPGEAFLQSLSPHGLARYVSHNRVLDDGVVHMVGRFVSNSLLGPSIVSLRVVSVAFGTLAVLLCYVLARQFVSPLLAFVAAGLLATDPAQLFWSRIEASQIIAASVAGFGTALVSIWLVRSWSVSSGVATMLWIPFTRYFYGAAIGLAALPAMVALIGTARRDSRRRALRSGLFVLAGSVLWWHSSSFLHSAAIGEWRPISTLNVYGRPLYEPHDPENELRDLSALETVRVQAVRGIENGVSMLRHMAHDRRAYSNWLMMAQADDRHRRSIAAAVFALLVPAVGYLCGRARRDPEMAVLVAWLIALSVPGLFSEDPAPRRVVGTMAGAYVVIAVFLGAVIDAFGGASRAARTAPRLALVGAAVCVAMINLSSHLLTGRQDPGVARYARFLAPIFANHDAVYHNIEDGALAATLVFANAEHFSRTLPCFQQIGFVPDPLSPPPCVFDPPIYANLFPESTLGARSKSLQIRRVAYLQELTSEESLQRYYHLRGRLPSATVTLERMSLPPAGLIDVAVVSTEVGP